MVLVNSTEVFSNGSNHFHNPLFPFSLEKYKNQQSANQNIICQVSGAWSKTNRMGEVTTFRPDFKYSSQ